MKQFFSKIKDDYIEIWLGALLFVGLPFVSYLYFGTKAFIATTIIIQAVILTLVIYKGNKWAF